MEKQVQLIAGKLLFSIAPTPLRVLRQSHPGLGRDIALETDGCVMALNDKALIKLQLHIFATIENIYGRTHFTRSPRVQTLQESNH